jgi:hypothetical protein
MTSEDDPAPFQFTVMCCREGGRRLLLPSGVLVCKHCDRAAIIPRAAEAVEVPTSELLWPPA